MGYKIKNLEIYPYGMKAIFVVEATGEVQFEIPATFNIDTVKPIISGAVDLAYFQTRMINRPHYVPAELKELHGKVHDKYRQMNLLQAKIALLEEGNKLFNMMPEKIGADAASYIRDVQKIRLENKEEAHRLSTAYEEARKEYEILNNEYALKIPQNVTQVIEVRCGVHSGTLEVEAFCNNASWTPSYRFNLDSETGVIESTFLADVRQHSGLSFMGEVKLFTQNPSTSVQIPRLYTWALDFVPDAPPVSSYARMEKSSRNNIMNQIMHDEKCEEECLDFMGISAEAPAPVMTESLINMAITATAKVDGNNIPVSMDLKKFKIPAKHKVMLCRDYGQEGWLVCTVDDMPEPILPGKVELYVDGQPAGTTHIGYIGRNENAEISFGQMPLVKLKKDTLTAVSGTQSRFLSSSGSIEDGYMLEVTNGSSIEVNVELLDKIPYPVNEKIALEVITMEPAASENKENVLKWKFSMKPGEKQLVSVKYKIKYPADKKLQY